MSGNSLIDLGKLAEPATKLIEKVSDAVGGIAKPWQIKRVASAEAAAAKIAARVIDVLPRNVRHGLPCANWSLMRRAISYSIRIRSETLRSH